MRLGLGELYQNPVSDDIIFRQFLTAMRFLEEVNAYLEQLNATKCHKDPFLVAFTLTTDELAYRVLYGSWHDADDDALLTTMVRTRREPVLRFQSRKNPV